MTKTELRRVRQRIDPLLKEFFERYVIIGVPVDKPDLGVLIATTCTTVEHKEQLENLIVSYAQEILIQRRAMHPQ